MSFVKNQSIHQLKRLRRQLVAIKTLVQAIEEPNLPSILQMALTNIIYDIRATSRLVKEIKEEE